MALYNVPGRGYFESPTPPDGDPDKIKVAVVLKPDDAFQMVSAGDVKNAVGRIFITLSAFERQKQARRAAAEEQRKKQEEARQKAKQECAAANKDYSTAARADDNARSDWLSAFKGKEHAAGAIDADLASVDNYSLGVGAVHDFVNAGSEIAGLAPNPIVDAMADLVQELNGALRMATRSRLLDLIPGSTPIQARGINDLIGTSANSLSLANFAAGGGAGAGNLASLASLGSFGYEVGQNIERGGLREAFRSEVPLVGNVTKLPNDELRALADRVRPEYPEIADKMDKLADAREQEGKSGQEVREKSPTRAARLKDVIGICVQRKK